MTSEQIRELIGEAHDEYLDTLELILKEVNKELKIVSHAEIKTEFEKEEEKKLKELKKEIMGELGL